MPSAADLIIDLLAPGAHPEYDASLLFCHMALLGIERERLAADDPLLFREMQARCMLCNSKALCVQELGLLGIWPDYCPHAAMLAQIEECYSGDCRFDRKGR
jgi:hypothetical protein